MEWWVYVSKLWFSVVFPQDLIRVVRHLQNLHNNWYLLHCKKILACNWYHNLIQDLAAHKPGWLTWILTFPLQCWHCTNCNKFYKPTAQPADMYFIAHWSRGATVLKRSTKWPEIYMIFHEWSKINSTGAFDIDYKCHKNFGDLPVWFSASHPGDERPRLGQYNVTVHL